jgi:hypothetical protein
MEAGWKYANLPREQRRELVVAFKLERQSATLPTS